MNNVVVSAPGKLIIHGEHAVVYGKTAVASSVNLRTYVKLERNSDTSVVSVRLPDIGVKKEFTLRDLMGQVSLPLSEPLDPKEANAQLLAKLRTIADVQNDSSVESLALVSVLYLYSCISFHNEKLPALRIEFKSNLPTGAGLGSSAAFSTCLAAALLLNRNLLTSKERSEDDDGAASTRSWSGADLQLINQWAFMSEKIIHGNPSGIDNAVSTFGGALTFLKGNITPMPKLPKIRIILFNTKKSRSTKQLVSQVREKYNEFPDIMEPVMCSLEAIVHKFVHIGLSDSPPDNEKYGTFQELIRMNQCLLDLIGVNHPTLRRLCDIASNHGLTAKLTGAGGGGCAFAVVPQDVKQEVVQACIHDAQANEFEAWETSIGGLGVLQHISLNDTNYAIPCFNVCDE